MAADVVAKSKTTKTEILKATAEWEAEVKKLRDEQVKFAKEGEDLKKKAKDKAKKNPLDAAKWLEAETKKRAEVAKKRRIEINKLVQQLRTQRSMMLLQLKLLSTQASVFKLHLSALKTTYDKVVPVLKRMEKMAWAGDDAKFRRFTSELARMMR